MNAFQSQFLDPSNPTSRPDKTLQWLEKSRDSWKRKTKETKEELKKKKLAVKRARENRGQLEEELKQALYKSQEALTQKDTELENLRDQLAKANQQVEELKKKRSLHGQANPAFTHTGIVS